MFANSIIRVFLVYLTFCVQASVGVEGCNGFNYYSWSFKVAVSVFTFKVVPIIT